MSGGTFEDFTYKKCVYQVYTFGDITKNKKHIIEGAHLNQINCLKGAHLTLWQLKKPPCRCICVKILVGWGKSVAEHIATKFYAFLR